MKAPGQGGDLFAAQIAEDQLAGMAFHRGDGKLGNGLIRHHGHVFDAFGQARQPRAQSQNHLGPEISGQYLLEMGHGPFLLFAVVPFVGSTVKAMINEG